MSNILKTAQEANNLEILRELLRSKGCNVCDNADMSDITCVINDQLSCPGDPVVNAILCPGPGVKITPFDRKGYKISASDEALLSGDIADHLPQGTTVHKALYDIIHNQIPDAIRQAASAPAIVDVEVFRAPLSGKDYYSNKAFGDNGQGSKSGLCPGAWYLRIYTFSQIEPLYTDLSPMTEYLKANMLKRTQALIDRAMTCHLQKYHSVDDGGAEDNPCPPPSNPDCACGGGCGCNPDDIVNIEDYINQNDPGNG